MPDLSILIPARNEEFLQRTLDDVFEHIEGDTEIIVGLDGWRPEYLSHFSFGGGEIVEHGGRYRFLYLEKPIGQRAMTNKLAGLSEAKYLMKLDAHVSMSQGFDVKMMEDMQDDTIIVPALGNLHAYDWVCPEGHRNQQGKCEKCGQCGSADLRKDMVWQVIHKPLRSSFCFDTALHFQYSKEDTQELLSETMSIQGSCFMITREKYHELNICDEAFGSWGQQGTEVACKTWLSGGRVLSTKKAYYGHQFRVTEGFPYENPVPKILETQTYSRNLFLNNKWPQQKKSIQWLIEKFNYQADWTPEKVAELCAPFSDVV